MKSIIAFFILSLFFLALSCSNIKQGKNHAKVEPINPNGDSELALLMREMFDEAMIMKLQVENGEKPTVLKKFEQIHTAKATEPEKAQSKKFKIFADAYLASVKTLKTATPENATDLYRGMIKSCMNCHRSMCPGPMVKIKKLYPRKQ